MEPVKFIKKGRIKSVRKREEDSESEDDTVVKSKKVNFQKKNTVTSTNISGKSSLIEEFETSSVNTADPPIIASDHTKNSNQTLTRPGPVQAKHILPTTFIDYAPDICKDYKQTGFCGFGDTCKFLHDREDYKAGWQLDHEWDLLQHKKRSAILHGNKYDSHTDDSSSENDEIPFACFICRKEYVQPIVTKCGHYFCESCAIQRYRKNPNCIICGAGTSGIFNTAKKLQSKLLQKQQRINEKHVSSDI
ncbi:hypothetical protein T552_03190 [Pneumocystis carinii B80]|uniref:Pre-mRNA-splicing factor CWC24 n=1 Tax=Pneumocystis carinii (strain B80) TaxID=1408658 RepID=A0A0W4ZC18_PNEC8|nr:hypothetical protein T552_03190 [Pneumocystis carinii B80]KTW25916.1 hypothetical protein T552_03190 [Pneumocystis carinii B80]